MGAVSGTLRTRHEWRLAVALAGLLVTASAASAAGGDVRVPPSLAWAVKATVAKAADQPVPPDRFTSAVAPAPVSHVPRVMVSVSTTRRVIALTFDLDMTPGMAAGLRARFLPANLAGLDVLRATGTRATLFMTGMWTEIYPRLARQLADDGRFEIANHSYSHPAFRRPCYNLAPLGPGGAALELQRSQLAIQRITGVTPLYFRFPGGCYDPAAVDAVRAAGLIPVGWSVNSIDAFNPSASQIASGVLAAAHPGAIVLMHIGPNAPATPAALASILRALRADGYEFVTVGELLQMGLAVEDPRDVVEARQPPAARSRPAARPIRWCYWKQPGAKTGTWVRC